MIKCNYFNAQLAYVGVPVSVLGRRASSIRRGDRRIPIIRSMLRLTTSVDLTDASSVLAFTIPAAVHFGGTARGWRLPIIARTLVKVLLH